MYVQQVPLKEPAVHYGRVIRLSLSGEYCQLGTHAVPLGPEWRLGIRPQGEVMLVGTDRAGLVADERGSRITATDGLLPRR